MNWTIREIESITEDKAKEIAIETLDVKDHIVYLVDFEGYFGYSALVFKNGKHIYYANDYELHHEHLVKEKGKSALRDYYVEHLNNKLFTEEELVAPIKNYSEFNAKEYYLRNYYPMQTDYISCFRITRNKEEEKAYEKSIKGKHLNPISFCYMEDLEFIKHQAKLFAELQKRKNEMSDNYEYWVDAFVREMYNHEYSINWQADYDTLSAFGNIEWKRGEQTLNDMFDQIKFTETQRRAYREAKSRYYRQIREAELEEAI